MTRIVPAILCGGSGTRLWPLSRAARPKQLLPLLGERSLLAATVSRALGLPGVNGEDVILITGEAFLDAVRAEAETAGGANATFIVEPQGRNTAPAAALAAFAALERGEDGVVLLLPSDHHVGDEGAFAAAIAAGAALAEAGNIVTFGITPTSAHIGYGYIARGAPLMGGYRVAQFDEKPDLETAKRFLAEGGRDWNSGIYMFTPRTYLDELARHAPAARKAAEAAYRGGRGEGRVRRLDANAWAECPSISIDHAVAEKTDRAAMVPASMGWSDIGSWAALWEIAEKRDGNVLIGDVVAHDVADCYVRADGRLVALVGVKDLVVVETGEAVFIAPRARAEEVKGVVETLAKAGRKDVL